jgi:hypothetical protein
LPRDLAPFLRCVVLIGKQLRLSGWTLEPPQVIRKKPTNMYG